MSQENVELVERSLAVWNSGDVEGYAELLDPAFAFHTSGAFPSHDRVYRGHDGFRRFWGSFHDPWENLEIEIARLMDLGDQVMALLRFRAIGRESGVEVQMKFANLVTVADGLIAEVRAYADWDVALAAVGLSE